MQLEIILPEDVIVEEVETIGIAEHYSVEFGVDGNHLILVFYDFENSGFGPGEGAYANIYLDNDLGRTQQSELNITYAKAVDYDGTPYNINYGQNNIQGNEIPLQFSLHNAYPNPFNPVTNIRYEITEYSNVKITVYNLLGREVTTLYDGEREPGVYQLQWNSLNDSGTRISSGIYFIRMEANSNNDIFVKEQKVILLK